MIIGFSGSRHGMSQRQREFVWDFLVKLKYVQFVIHGDCIGADEIFHEMCETLRHRIEIYPSNNDKRRAWKIPTIGVIHDPMHPIQRNRIIVQQSTLILATPHTTVPVSGSGTWRTIGFGEEEHKKMIVVLPVSLSRSN